MLILAYTHAWQVWHIYIYTHLKLGAGWYIYKLTLASLYHYTNVAKSINNVTLNLNNRLWIHSTIIVKCESALLLGFVTTFRHQIHYFVKRYLVL